MIIIITTYFSAGVGGRTTESSDQRDPKQARIHTPRVPRHPSQFSTDSCRVYVYPTKLTATMREIVHMQAGQCGNQIGAKVSGWVSWVVEGRFRPHRRHGLSGLLLEPSFPLQWKRPECVSWGIMSSDVVWHMKDKRGTVPPTGTVCMPGIVWASPEKVEL